MEGLLEEGVVLVSAARLESAGLGGSGTGFLMALVEALSSVDEEALEGEAGACGCSKEEAGEEDAEPTLRRGVLPPPPLGVVEE